MHRAVYLYTYVRGRGVYWDQPATAVSDAKIFFSLFFFELKIQP